MMTKRAPQQLTATSWVAGQMLEGLREAVAFEKGQLHDTHVHVVQLTTCIARVNSFTKPSRKRGNRNG